MSFRDRKASIKYNVRIVPSKSQSIKHGLYGKTGAAELVNIFLKSLHLVILGTDLVSWLFWFIFVLKKLAAFTRNIKVVFPFFAYQSTESFKYQTNLCH